MTESVLICTSRIAVRDYKHASIESQPSNSRYPVIEMCQLIRPFTLCTGRDHSEWTLSMKKQLNIQRRSGTAADVRAGRQHVLPFPQSSGSPPRRLLRPACGVILKIEFTWRAHAPNMISVPSPFVLVPPSPPRSFLASPCLPPSC